MWKPYHEESIKREYRSHWNVWNAWPYDEGESMYMTADGYESMEQMMTGEDFLEEVHPGMTWDEMDKKAAEIRKISSVEIWEFIDSVWKEEEE